MAKQKFEVKVHFDASAGIHRKDVFVDEKLFEYEIDQVSLNKAKELGGYYYIQIQKEIQKHFLDSLSDFIGREITPTELMAAIQTGWI